MEIKLISSDSDSVKFYEVSLESEESCKDADVKLLLEGAKALEIGSRVRVVNPDGSHRIWLNTPTQYQRGWISVSEIEGRKTGP